MLLNETKLGPNSLALIDNPSYCLATASHRALNPRFVSLKSGGGTAVYVENNTPYFALDPSILHNNPRLGLIEMSVAKIFADFEDS